MFPPYSISALLGVLSIVAHDYCSAGNLAYWDETNTIRLAVQYTDSFRSVSKVHLADLC